MQQLNSRVNLLTRPFGISLAFSMPNKRKAGKAIDKERKALEVAVWNTAFFAAIFDLPILSCVSGCGISIPLSISHYRMQRLFATPPTAEAEVATITFMSSSLAPVARAVIPLHASLIPMERGTDVNKAAANPTMISLLVCGDFLELFP